MTRCDCGYIVHGACPACHDGEEHPEARDPYTSLPRPAVLDPERSRRHPDQSTLNLK